MLPLQDVRVLDLTAVVLGPLATQILADQGADVIKVESPDGDLMRKNGASLHPGMSSIYLALNRGKRSISLNLQAPESKAVLRRLIPSMDVFVHNMRVEAIERLGLGYTEVSALNPGIVYCVATGFDQRGPDRGKPAFDDIIQAACGLAALCGSVDYGPAYVPTLVADKVAGLALANAVLAALLQRSKTGRGLYVEVPMFETLVSFLLSEHLGGLTFESEPSPSGYVRILQGGRRPLRTQDGYVAMLPYTPRHWTMFFSATGTPHHCEKLQIVDELARTLALYAAVAEIALTNTTQYWIELCEKLDIPATRIYSLDQLPDHPQLKAVNFFKTMEHPSEGRVRYIPLPTRFGADETLQTRPAPLLGEHTAEILREAGVSEDELKRLRGLDAIVG